MNNFKCKMCGGSLSISEGQKVVDCDFCGSHQTVPTSTSDKQFNLHNRANSLRLINEFDKAIAIYETIISEFPSDAEAHFGLLLSRYGIEYVDDPKTGKKIPTCHRVQFKSIVDDIDYLEALKYSDVIEQKHYQDQVAQIAKIQKAYLEISSKEDKYDIFICYKETDSQGARTRDSVLAQEIYNELTKKKYKVFFARLSLESKIGSEYEPIIFSALHSAKVMLVIGTRSDYFNAVWVKNEWSRFLSIMGKSDEKKYLIPCYRDIDAYELPTELLAYQSQDMNKLGFIQDLTNGIDKIFDRKKIVIEPTSNQNYTNMGVAPLLKRARILISGGDFKKANEIIEQALNGDPENAEAYILLLMTELRINEESQLSQCAKPIGQYQNYKNALKFANEEYRNQIKGYHDKNLARIGIFKFNEALKTLVTAKILYNQAMILIKNYDFRTAIEKLEKIKGFNDVDDLMIRTKKQIPIEDAYQRAIVFSQSKIVNQVKEANLFFEKNKNYRQSAQHLKKSEVNLKLLIRKEKKAAIIVILIVVAFFLLGAIGSNFI